MTKKQKKTLIRILASAALLLAVSLIPSEGVLRLCLFMVPYLVIGYDILIKAARGIFYGQVLDECFLMAVATVGALALGYLDTGDYLEAVAVMLFYQVGELFQSYAVGKSRRSIGALMDIRPDVANLLVDGEVVPTDPEQVAVGSPILVRPGERVPIDGIIEDGSTELDTAALTGESAPRSASVGDEIYSGCINISGAIRVRTTKVFGESTVSRILDLVENATSRKSRSEDFISRFAKYYTPAVCAAALALALIPPLVGLIAVGEASFTVWLYRALTFLVISCPCALVISIPLSFFAGIGGAGRAGILVKGSVYLEALSKTSSVVFDKTGTLTEGRFSVTELHTEGISEQELLRVAAHAEHASTHPIGKSIVAAYGGVVCPASVSELRELGGGGVVCLVDSVRVAVGNATLMNELGIECPRVDGTVAYVAVSDALAGYIVISDRIKPSSREAVSALKSCGVRQTVMLTGDSRTVAERVAEELGVDRVLAELLPEDKVNAIEAVIESERLGKVVFVGDGINDAPVLGRADIGIAMGAMGSDAAIEAADVVLMDDDPRKVAKAVRISRKCMRIVYQNIVFAIGVKLLCLLLGAAGIANMWLAIFADVGVMVLAVLNAVRALFTERL